MGSKKKIDKYSFECGIVYAAAMLVQLHDQPSYATDILKESGADTSQAAEYDLKILKKAGLI